MHRPIVCPSSSESQSECASSHEVKDTDYSLHGEIGKLHLVQYDNNKMNKGHQGARQPLKACWVFVRRLDSPRLRSCHTLPNGVYAGVFTFFEDILICSNITFPKQIYLFNNKSYQSSILYVNMEHSQHYEDALF